MKRGSEVIIVGGGVIGLTTAYFLACEGVRVVVCDQGPLGMEASWAGAGILPPSHPEHAQYPLDCLRALSGSRFPALSRELLERTGIDNAFHVCGGLEFLDGVGRADVYEWHGLGVDAPSLTEAQISQLEPALAPHLGHAIHVPGMAQVRNPRHLRALHAACLSTNNVTFRQQTRIDSLVLANGRIKGVHTSGEILEGDAVLLAAGAWTDRLLQPLGFKLSIEAVRGQIALLNPEQMLFARILIWGHQYLVPRRDGRVLVGSTQERVGYCKTTTARGISELLALAIRIVPALADAPIEKTWAGLRPGNPDGLPFIGLVPGVENLYVAAGHYRAGIQLSPGTALLLKESILRQPLSMPMEAFRLDRRKETHRGER